MGARPRGRDDLGLHRIGQAQRAPCPEHHRQHGEARGGGGRCGRRAGLPAGLTPLACASRRFLYGHQHAAYSVENGSIALRVHDNPDFVISTKTGILSALYCTK
ncbi:threonine aldolase (plasmid) [Ralstonia solanacearum]|nr:threonine aldolase [Ralstonia solanacearum]